MNLNVKTYIDIKEEFETKWNIFVKRRYKEKTRLQEASLYALRGSGKRIRPSLVLLCNQLGKNNTSSALTPAFAIEMIHIYSLIHDDLPLMDNDDLRRGRATVHKKFDETTALLTGNALLTDAFNLLCSMPANKSSLIIRELAQACGSMGILEGQMRDIHQENISISIDELRQTHTLKTGKLLEASCVIGGICACLEPDFIKALRTYGSLLGLSFQIVDDLIDELTTTGKSKGKDKKQNKNTYPQIIGKQKSYDLAHEYTCAANEVLQPYQDQYNIQPLKDLSAQLINRIN
jgi:geranylgeranyl pyrophosphate synthase